jgi:ABC-type multidrug transport system fused ATPase/permease subunit
MVGQRGGGALPAERLARQKNVGAPAMSTMRALAIIWKVLTPAQRRRFVALQFLSLLMALSTVLGLAAVMTFLAVLADPGLLRSHAALDWISRMLAMDQQQFVIALGSAFIALLVLSALVNVAGSYAIGRFAYAVGDRTREVLFAQYLERDYLFHCRAGAGRLMDAVLNQADRVTITLLHGQLLVTNAVLTSLVVASIAVVDAQVALGGMFAVAGCYLLFYRIIRLRIERRGREQVQLSAQRVAVVQQALLGIKFVKVAQADRFFGDRLASVTRPLSHSFAEAQFIGQLPRYILECLAGAALIACAAFISHGTSSAAWLAQLSFIGFAGFRLLPAVQQMYQAFVIARNNQPAIDNLAGDLERGMQTTHSQPARAGSAGASLRQGIELAGVSFSYAPDGPAVLEEVSLRIEAGEAIGIVGASGCGKSTLLDLVLGLLVPDAGRIEVDGEALHACGGRHWQQLVGYVPQEVMILDATVRENIAFGVEREGIDDDRVREVARQAGVSDYIDSLPAGYDTGLSGPGGGLSGGQRQRIGIARALYRNPDLLVLDEATNSLDAETERAIIDVVVRNRGGRTVLVVAHGAAVIEACDRVYELRDRALHESGPPATPRRAMRLRSGAE